MLLAILVAPFQASLVISLQIYSSLFVIHYLRKIILHLIICENNKAHLCAEWNLLLAKISTDERHIVYIYVNVYRTIYVHEIVTVTVVTTIVIIIVTTIVITIALFFSMQTMKAVAERSDTGIPMQSQLRADHQRRPSSPFSSYKCSGY